MTNINLNRDLNLLSDYAISLIEKYIEVLHASGYKNVVGSYNNYTLIKYHLNKAKLERIINHLEPAILTIKSIENDINTNINQRDRDESFYLKRFLFMNKLQSDYNLDEIIDKDEVVEVYDHNGIQMYRSNNFFKYCSYSFEEIFSNEWWNLFERSVFVMKKLVEVTGRIIREQVRDIQYVNCPNHWTNETNSVRKLGIYIKQDKIIPLYNEKNVVSAVLGPFSVLKYINDNGDVCNVSKAQLSH